MMPRKKRPRDISQRAKLIVDIATGEVGDEEPTLTDTQKFARLGGLKGGKARALQEPGPEVICDGVTNRPWVIEDIIRITDEWIERQSTRR